ncbi:hypothetical protein OFO10_06160 [Campylobacter sp. VBCF_06 NA8]|uniref:hypothetical protein n=1 Tax=Campylobacter sp. VBCF_06 NA8 TaxID=2983822 RepID=UPI0022EA0970|nr:hypothetical protein [Campylobacter sp. VBCF_06 NA8]MDA3046738.1 hypothetical protein [Campylobacter sp. VBCF_06 NA8]
MQERSSSAVCACGLRDANLASVSALFAIVGEVLQILQYFARPSWCVGKMRTVRVVAKFAITGAVSEWRRYGRDEFYRINSAGGASCSEFPNSCAHG